MEDMTAAVEADMEVDMAAVLEAAMVVDSEVVATAVDTVAVLEVDLGEAEVDMTLVAMITLA